MSNKTPAADEAAGVFYLFFVTYSYRVFLFQSGVVGQGEYR